MKKKSICILVAYLLLFSVNVPAEACCPPGGCGDCKRCVNDVCVKKPDGTECTINGCPGECQSGSCHCTAECCSDADCGDPACWDCTGNCECECDITINSVSSNKDSAAILCENITFTASVTGSCSCVDWSGGGTPPSQDGGCSFTTHWDSPDTKTVTATPDCGSSKSKQVTIVCPTGETTEFFGWSGPAAGFMSQLTPTARDFSCLTVRERDGTGSHDGCWFEGSIYEEKYESLAGPYFTWPVEAGNWWGPDWLSWGTLRIDYYRNNPPPPDYPAAPCCTNIAQIMDVVEEGCGDYAGGMLTLWINTTTVAATRNGFMVAKPWP